MVLWNLIYGIGRTFAGDYGVDIALNAWFILVGALCAAVFVFRDLRRRTPETGAPRQGIRGAQPVAALGEGAALCDRPATQDALHDRM